jgi:cyclopropane fatty-acyl-phospholipid synthase-like methyltransferase
MGCGVGGVAIWIAKRMPLRISGVTLSPRQAAEGRRRVATGNLEDRVHVAVGDYERLDPPSPFDAAYAVESFAHASGPEAFFGATSALIRPGGFLVVADDFLSHRGRRNPFRPALRRFRRGWHIRTLITAQEAVIQAGRRGFTLVRREDLTAYVAVPPAALLYARLMATWLPLSLPYWQSLRGGSALQLCYDRGLTEYHLLTFEKQ